MVTISFTQFRQNAKAYFDAVEKGEIIQVQRHGKIIAKITSPAKPKFLPPLIIPGLVLSKEILKDRKKNSR